MTEKGISRREALKRLGGTAAALGAGFVGGAVAGQTPAVAGEDSYESELRLSEDLPTGDSAGPYGGEFAPPRHLTGDALDGVTYPPSPSRQAVREIEMTVVEKQIEVANGLTYEAWTYNGSAPGPIIRATEGELLRIRFRNATGHNHNLHFHGRHSVQHDGWQPVVPGGEVIYEIEAGPAGFHPYHCHVPPISHHISRGLYGSLIVDPAGGRPPAQEVVLVLSGWDPDHAGYNRVYTWNGVAGFYSKFPIKVNVGEPVRAYVLNMMELDPIGSFHLHAETFDVFPSGTSLTPSAHTDVVTLGQTERAVLEFTLPERGRYMFHPHQGRIAAQGAMGWFSAV